MKIFNRILTTAAALAMLVLAFVLAAALHLPAGLVALLALLLLGAPAEAALLADIGRLLALLAAALAVPVVAVTHDSLLSRFGECPLGHDTGNALPLSAVSRIGP